MFFLVFVSIFWLGSTALVPHHPKAVPDPWGCVFIESPTHGVFHSTTIFCEKWCGRYEAKDETVESGTRWIFECADIDCEDNHVKDLTQVYDVPEGTLTVGNATTFSCCQMTDESNDKCGGLQDKKLKRVSWQELQAGTGEVSTRISEEPSSTTKPSLTWSTTPENSNETTGGSQTDSTETTDDMWTFPVDSSTTPDGTEPTETSETTDESWTEPGESTKTTGDSWTIESDTTTERPWTIPSDSSTTPGEPETEPTTTGSSWTIERGTTSDVTGQTESSTTSDVPWTRPTITDDNWTLPTDSSETPGTEPTTTDGTETSKTTGGSWTIESSTSSDQPRTGQTESSTASEGPWTRPTTTDGSWTEPTESRTTSTSGGPSTGSTESSGATEEPTTSIPKPEPEGQAMKLRCSSDFSIQSNDPAFRIFDFNIAGTCHFSR